jgi:subtilisin family serine protease
MTMKRNLAPLLLAAALLAACAQAPKRVERADDLPRFTYAVPAELEPVVRDPQRFEQVATPMRRDIEGMLAHYDIAERATQRRWLGVLVQLDLLDGRYDDAVRRSATIRELQEKPADKLLSGLTVRAIAQAVQRTGGRDTPAYRAEVARFMDAELERMPFTVVRNEVMGAKAGLSTLGEALALGQVRTVLQPVAQASGSLSSDLAPALVSARFVIVYLLPLKQTLVDTYSRYIARHQVDKPDIWKARDADLPPGRPYAPVDVVIWDSGVDTALFPGRLVMSDGQPALVAFDLHALPSTQPLKPIPAALSARLPSLLARTKGLSDLQSNIDSPEAAAVRDQLSNLQPAEYRSVIEELMLASVYQHGTHVAGIAMAGNPYARVANARIDFGTTLRPDPCPSPELEQRIAANFTAYAGFIRHVGARVVNMSWGESLRSIEDELEQCGIGADAAARKALARQYFDGQRQALEAAIASVPNALFVAAAGNAADDPSFNESFPSGLTLPNVVVVGAVDKAGDEASFTSYGPTVALHANGYQVESVVPGGHRVAFSGTSMAAPQVTNLAAKMFAVKPSLTPAEAIAIMRRTADRTEDGRRTLIHPARALAAVGYAP